MACPRCCRPKPPGLSSGVKRHPLTSSSRTLQTRGRRRLSRGTPLSVEWQVSPPECMGWRKQDNLVSEIFLERLKLTSCKVKREPKWDLLGSCTFQFAMEDVNTKPMGRPECAHGSIRVSLVQGCESWGLRARGRSCLAVAGAPFPCSVRKCPCVRARFSTVPGNGLCPAVATRLHSELLRRSVLVLLSQVLTTCAPRWPSGHTTYWPFDLRQTLHK